MREPAHWTATERTVEKIWSSLLGTDELPLDGDFFHSGGDSFLATKAVLAVRRTFHVTITVQALIDAPVLREFARRIDAARVSA